jgi:hypothetical protein
MQTMTDEDATSGFCTNTSSPISPIAPSLQAARDKVHRHHQSAMSEQPGVLAILPPALHIESLGFANVVATWGGVHEGMSLWSVSFKGRTKGNAGPGGTDFETSIHVCYEEMRENVDERNDVQA